MGADVAADVVSAWRVATWWHVYASHGTHVYKCVCSCVCARARARVISGLSILFEDFC